MLTHLGVFSSLQKMGFVPEGIIPVLHARTGVQAFFALSGFLITMLLIREHTATGSVALKKFFARRAVRIFPLYIFFLCAITFIAFIEPKVASRGSLLYAYGYAYNFVPRELYSPLLGHTWSLAVEEHFYLVWPAIFAIAFAGFRKSLGALLALFFVAASTVIYPYLTQSGLGEEFFVDRWSFVAGGSIGLGCLAALLVCDPQANDVWRRSLQTRLAVVVGILLVVNTLWLSNPTACALLRTLGVTVVIVWVYLNQQSLLVRLLEIRPLAYVGMISYGVYMYQGLLLSTGPRRVPGQMWPPDPMWGVLLLIVIAPLSFHFLERPLLRLKVHFS